MNEYVSLFKCILPSSYLFPCSILHYICSPPECDTICASIAAITMDSLQAMGFSSSMCPRNSVSGPGAALRIPRSINVARISCAFKIAKGKKGPEHEYPWPKKISAGELKDGYLKHLSRFKPLPTKQKLVTLPFEKPLAELDQAITQVRNTALETGMDFSDQISTLEANYEQVLKELYAHLTPVQRLSVARHPNRPTCLDHILNMTDKWIELHGDRAGYDDPAIVTGIGTINGMSLMFIGHQKGRNTKENIHRNFAMPTPHGYRKALRMMEHANHHGFPIITMVDTPGAYADIKSEEAGQGEAIAHNLRSMFALKVPVISVVIGEGGSGGALAIGCCNKMLMLENSVYYVASPEACAAILWKRKDASPMAAEKLRITAQELQKFGITDEVIQEPLGGAHADASGTSNRIKAVVMKHMEELLKMSPDELQQHRMAKFRAIGRFQQSSEIEPQKTRNMKKQESSPSLKLDVSSEDKEFPVSDLHQAETVDIKFQHSNEPVRAVVNNVSAHAR